MIRLFFVVSCFVAVPWVHAQLTIDADTGDLPRAYGDTWWFDDDNSGNAIVVSNINTVATPNGPLPGWAWTRLNFMVASNFVVTEAGAADVVSTPTAAGPGDILAPGPVEATVTNDLTIGSLVTDADFFIGNGATLTLDGGGLMFRGANHNLRSPSGSAPGFLTSSYTSGNGTNELFVTVTDNGTVYQIFGIEIVDDGATPVTVIVDGYDTVDEGEIRFSDENHYSGGTIVNGAMCWAANDESFGSGPVTVRDTGATVYIATSSGTFTNDFYIAGNGWVDGFFGPLGALRLTSGATLTGDIILTNHARIGNTSSGSNPARIEGLISGPYDLEFFEDGKFLLTQSGHTYSNTTVSTGVLQLGQPGAPAGLPSNTTLSVEAAGEFRGFTDYDGTVDLFGALTPGFVHLPQTNTYNEAIFRAGSTIRMDLSLEAKDLIHFEDLTIDGGTVDLNIIGELVNGNYAIMTYSNLVGVPVPLALTGDTGRRTATLVTNLVAKQINVNVTGATPPLSWVPMGGSDLWDLDTSTNWSFGLGGPQKFKTADPVVFGVNPPFDVKLVGSLTPGVVFVVGPNDRSFGGNGRLIGNGDLNMNGTGSLTISNNNDAFGFDTYKGLITVASGGTLVLGNNGALGDISVGTVIRDGGTLALNGKNIDFEPVSVAGAGVGGLGAIVNHVSVPLSFNLSDITLTNHTTFGGTFNWTAGFNNFATPGSLSTGGQPYNLTKAGPNQISLRIVDVDPALAQIDIEEGVFGFLSGVTGLGNPAATMNIESNATFFHNNPHFPAIKQFDFKDGSEMRSQSSGNVVDGEVKLTGTVLFDVDSGNLTVDAPIIGPGGIEKIDGGQLIFTASNTYAGLTHIKEGWLILGNDTPEGSFGTGPVLMTGSVSRIGVKLTTDASVLNPITGRGVIELFGTNTTEFGFIDMPGPFNGSVILFGYPFTSPTLHVTTNSDIRIEEMVIGINFGGQGNILQTGGSLETTDFSSPLRLANSGGSTGIYDLVEGRFTSTNSGIHVGFHGDAVWNISGGTATVSRVVLNAFSSTGSGTLDMSGGVLEVGDGGISNVGVPYAATLSGGTLRAFETNGPVSVDVTLENLPVIDTVTNIISLSGDLSGPGGFTKEGPGTLVVNGTNSCSGTLTVVDGTFRQDSSHTGAGLTDITNDAVMTGSGSTDGSVTIAALATLAPSPQLNVTGNVTIEGTYAVDVAGASIDQVLGINELSLNAGSVLAVSGALTESEYVIMTYADRAGMFDDDSAVTSQNYSVIYDDVAGEVRLVWDAPIIDLSEDAGELTVFWESETGSVYWLEHRSNMLTGAWMPLPPYTNLSGTAGVIIATNLPMADPEGYFRLLEDE